MENKKRIRADIILIVSLLFVSAVALAVILLTRTNGGYAVVTLDGKEVGRRDICVTEDVGKLGFFGILWRMLGRFLLK